MKARRLFQPIAHSQAQASIPGALGIDGGDRCTVKPPESVEDPVGLLGGVPGCAQRLHLEVGKQVPILLEADDPLPCLQDGADIGGTAAGLAGNSGHRGVGGIVAILHARSPGRLAARDLLRNGLIHGHLAQNTTQVLQRQTAGTQEPGRGNGEVDNGGLHPHPAGPAVHDAVNFPVHILQHIGGTGGAGAA